ncbi:MAG: elongation factor P [Anaerolineae bacterium]
MTVSVTELRKGVTFEDGGDLFRVVEYQHIKVGRGSATIRLKLRNLRTGSNVEKTYPNGGVVNDVRLDNREVEYLYTDGEEYHFMDKETFDQFGLREDKLGNAVKYLQEGMTLELSSYEGEPLDLELPTTVDLKIVETSPGFKGDTASGGGKPATLETGLVINVPFFVNQGDTVRVDTRTNEYVTRV